MCVVCCGWIVYAFVLLCVGLRCCCCCCVCVVVVALRVSCCFVWDVLEFVVV